MPEIRNVQSQQVDQPCPKCGQGYMRPNGIVTMSNPPQFEHTCTACGYKQLYNVRYPQII